MRMKMNTLIVLALISALPAAALAQTIRGGESVSFSFARCDALAVNITGAELGEWTAAPDCTEDAAGNFSCGCEDVRNVSLTPASNSVGTFDITLTSYVESVPQPAVQAQVVSSGGGWVPTSCKKYTYYCSGKQVCCEGLECVNDICLEAVTTTTTVPEQDEAPATTTTTTQPEGGEIQAVPGYDWTTAVFLAVGVAAAGIALWFVYRRINI